MSFNYKTIKKILLLTMGFFSLFGCEKKNCLTEAETNLIKKINFDLDLANEIKLLTKAELKQLPAIDSETGDVLDSKLIDGLFSVTIEEEAIEFVKNKKSSFKEKGHLVFVFEGENNEKSIAFIKGNDELNILRYRRTDGINYDLENKDIVKKISDWKLKYGLTVIGCGRDWLQIEFEKLPANLNVFAEEVYQFCPDSVDQGVGTVANLKQTIAEMKGIWLWRD